MYFIHIKTLSLKNEIVFRNLKSLWDLNKWHFIENSYLFYTLFLVNSIVSMLILLLLTIIYPKVTESLVKLPFVSDNPLLITAQSIRETVNSIFFSLKLPKLKEKSKLEGYTILHKYFMSHALQDYSVLNEIASLTRVSNKNGNKSTYFVDIINDIIDQSENNENELKYDGLVLYIEHFLSKLNSYKKQYSDVYVSINEKVLKHLRHLKPLNSSKTNVTKLYDDDDDAIHSENEFWEPSGRRVFKGKRSRIRDYPFMASIHIFDSFHCAGSIISSDLILTASSCLQLAYNNRLFRENPAFLSVRIGSSFFNGGGESISVLEVYFYPNYNPKTLRHNICVLRLTRRIKFGKSRKVRKIKLDQAESSIPVVTPGVTIVGWGAKEHGGKILDPWTNILSYADLDIYPYSDCRDIYGKDYVYKENFCAGFISRGGGACNRDVGGPGIISRRLTGIVSFGSPVCGSPDTPTVFTKVGYYYDWIEQIMEQDVPTALGRTTNRPTTDIYLKIMNSPPPTTIKIPPITGKLEAKSIFDVENALRNFDDKLFKEFINTVFTSQDLNEYEELLRILEMNQTEEEFSTQNDSDVTQTSEKYDAVVPFTVLAELADDVDVTETDIVMQDTINATETIEDNESFDLSQLINDEDLKKIIEEEILVANITDDVIADMQVDDNDSTGFVSSNEINDKNNKEGLSIPSENFNDFTRSKNNTKDLLSDDEFYKIFSDVIFQQKKKKD